MDRSIGDLLRSGDGGRLPQRCTDDAHHPLLDARDIAPGLHPHRPRQGRLGSIGQLSPRVEERHSSCHHRDWHRGGVPDRRVDRHRNCFQYSGRRPLPGGGAALARLSDRAESGDAYRGGRGGRKIYGRYALRRDRSADPVWGLGDVSLAVINYDNELRRAGAKATHGWRRLIFLAQRYMLGTVGLIIMLLFVWVAISADLISRFDPLSVDSAHRLAPPDARHWMGTDS